MTRLSSLLASYGRYHRDPRNRLTHYFGVPAIIYAVLIPAALYGVAINGVSFGLDRIIVAAAVVGYLAADIRLGSALAVVLVALAAAAEATTMLGSAVALGVAVATFVAGWALQLLGHHLERNRPAFLTNLAQLVVAPLYLSAEIGFALGLRSSLRADVERQLGASPSPQER
jgi:uncharacterized membrane protein YGL010W